MYKLMFKETTFSLFYEQIIPNLHTTPNAFPTSMSLCGSFQFFLNMDSHTSLNVCVLQRAASNEYENTNVNIDFYEQCKLNTCTLASGQCGVTALIEDNLQKDFL